MVGFNKKTVICRAVKLAATLLAVRPRTVIPNADWNGNIAPAPESKKKIRLYITVVI